MSERLIKTQSPTDKSVAGIPLILGMISVIVPSASRLFSTLVIFMITQSDLCLARAVIPISIYSSGGIIVPGLYPPEEGLLSGLSHLGFLISLIIFLL